MAASCSASADVDRRAVLGADVVALAHALGGVVALPEHLEQLVDGDDLGIEHDQHGLGVAGAARAGLLVGGVGRDATGVAHGGDPHAGDRPEGPLGPPEAAHPDDEGLEPLGVGRRERVAVHEVLRGHGHGGVAAGQGLGGGGEVERLAQSEHGGEPPTATGCRARGRWGSWVVGELPALRRRRCLGMATGPGCSVEAAPPGLNSGQPAGIPVRGPHGRLIRRRHPCRG